MHNRVVTVLLIALAMWQMACGGRVQRLPAPEAPVFFPASGTYDFEFEIQIEAPDGAGMEIWYTTDGTDPSWGHGKLYQGALKMPFPGYRRIKAVVISPRGHMPSSATIAEYYSVVPPPPPPGQVYEPVFDPGPGSYIGAQQLTMTSQTPGAEIWYSTDKSTPAPNDSRSKRYTGPITLSENAVIKAIAVKDGMFPSRITRGEYYIFIPPPPQTCDGEWELWCHACGHVSSYVDPYTDRFNLDLDPAPADMAWCTSNHVWFKDLLGPDVAWMCHLDPNDTKMVMYDARGQPTLEGEYIFCDFDRIGEVHGESDEADARRRFENHPSYQPNSPKCIWLKQATKTERKGGLGYVHVRNLVTGEEDDYFYKKDNG